uniref:glutathione transferase n=2 Tax=Photinus pyralis TaxID=7054 RepID=A0A1Y1MW73_PHOPY
MHQPRAENNCIENGMTPTYHLTYFQSKALAEPIRFLFSYGNIEFEDIRIEKSNWPEIKPSLPFGQAPVLEFNGIRAYQSIAITRYVAKQVKLAGANDVEDLEIDAVVDTVNDLRIKISEFCYEMDSVAKERRRQSLFDEVLPYYLERFETIVENNNGHLATGKLTWADIHFVGILDYLSFMTGKTIIAGYPGLQNLEKTILNLPGIKEWVAKRPVTRA